jgi:hypothetical protein
MSKNLTRKGLAFGAILALGSTLFAGTAAHAADELTLTPSAGTSYNTIEGENFTLLAGLAPATNAANTVQLKYSVTTTATLGSMANAYVNGTAAATTAVAGAAGSNTTVYKLTTGTATVGAVQKFVLASPASVAAATPATATVTAFFDANSNDVLDAGEYTSAARTVKWSDAADVTATVTLTTPTEGDTTVKASLVLADVNQDQIPSAHIGAYFSNADGVAALGGTNPSVAAGTPNVASAGTGLVVAGTFASGAFPLTTGTITALGTSGGAKVSIYYLATATANTSFVDLTNVVTAANFALTNLLGYNMTSAIKAISARTATSITASAAASANNSYTAGTIANAASATPATSNISTRANSEFTVTAKVLDSATTPAALAGAAVTATITLGGGAPAIDATHTITVNGTTYNTAAAFTAAQTAKWALTTGADGTVAIKINTVGFAASNTFAVAFAVQGYTSTITATNATLAYTLVADAATVVANVTRSVTKGDSFSIAYTLVDTFKQTPATGNYRVVSTATAGAGITAGATYTTLTAGKGTVTYAPTALGSFTVAPTVEVQDATTLNWGAQAATAPATVTVNVIAAQTDAASAAVAYDGAQTSANVASAAEKAVDTRSSYDVIAAYTAVESALVSGQITNSISGVGRSGAFVTVSGTGLLFSNAVTRAGVTSATIFKADSITVPADASGNYAVVALSNIAGTVTVTVKSGNATKTVDVKFASTLAAASVVMGDVAAQAQAGRAVELSATLKDKYGNAATTANNVTFAVSGSGYLQTTAAVAASATTGVAANRLIVLGQDLGTSTITASIVDPADSTKTISASKSIEFGVTDADVTVGGRAVYASVEFAKGKTVTVTVDGKRLYSKLFSTDAYTELKFTQKNAGKHTVTIRVSGGIVYSEVVTTTK